MLLTGQLTIAGLQADLQQHPSAEHCPGSVQPILAPIRIATSIACGALPQEAGLPALSISTNLGLVRLSICNTLLELISSGSAEQPPEPTLSPLQQVLQVHPFSTS